MCLSPKISVVTWGNQMKELALDEEQKTALTQALQRYMEEELDTEIGQFDALFLLDFVASKIGPAFYNKGLSDAHDVMQRRMLDVADDLYAIEQPIT